jgi:hypothetical protein
MDSIRVGAIQPTSVPPLGVLFGGAEASLEHFGQLAQTFR